MEKPFELAYTELKKGCFPEELSFRTTAEIKPLEGVIGQERAVKAFDFGLAVKMKGYNIYMAGPSGTGKTTYARNSTEKLAQTEPVPYDWCYVYNFQNPRSPLALRSSRDRASSSRRTWQSWCSFSKRSCRRRSVRRITKHRKTLWSIPLMKRETRLWQK